GVLPQIVSCTFSANSAFGGPGGDGGAGGACFDGGTAASGGPGGSGYGFGGGIICSNVVVQSTIVANNASYASADITGAVQSLGHNLVGQTNDSSGWVATDLAGTTASPLDPRLGHVQDNGGPTWTMALLGGSPAIDA